jgi:hypothetical protein
VRGVGGILGVWRKDWSWARNCDMSLWSEILRESCAGAVAEVGAMLAELGSANLTFAKLLLRNVLRVTAQQ